VVHKKQDITISVITLSYVNRFSQFLHRYKENYIFNKIMYITHITLTVVPQYRRKFLVYFIFKLLSTILW